jgi:hypothetical protein
MGSTLITPGGMDYTSTNRDGHTAALTKLSAGAAADDDLMIANQYQVEYLRSESTCTSHPPPKADSLA